MPDAPTPVLPAYTPATPTAPTAVQSGGQPSAPTAPANSTGSGTISAPTAPAAVQSGGQPSAPTAPSAPIASAPPLAPAAATLLLNPIGDNNSILITAKAAGLSGNEIQVALPIDVVEGNEYLNAAPYVSALFGAYLLACDPAYRLRVTGTLTSDGSTPVTFPAMIGAPDTDGKSAWSATGSAPSIGTSNSVRWDSGNACWRLQSGSAVWLSSDSVWAPQLCTTWEAQGSATGTPVFASEACTAAEMITVINADTELPFTAANGPGSDGSGALRDAETSYLAGGSGPIAPTSVLP